MHNSAPQYTRIDAGCTATYEEKYLTHINIRYENHTRDSFKYKFKTSPYETSIILRETYDRSQIQMYCTSEDGILHCPNYGKFLLSSALQYTVKCTITFYLNTYINSK